MWVYNLFLELKGQRLAFGDGGSEGNGSVYNLFLELKGQRRHIPSI